MGQSYETVVNLMKLRFFLQYGKDVWTCTNSEIPWKLHVFSADLSAVKEHSTSVEVHKAPLLSKLKDQILKNPEVVDVCEKPGSFLGDVIDDCNSSAGNAEFRLAHFEQVSEDKFSAWERDPGYKCERSTFSNQQVPSTVPELNLRCIA